MTACKKQPPGPFEFWRPAYLVEVTQQRAHSLGQLLSCVTLAPPASLFYHLHRGMLREPTMLPDSPNDFAEWTETSLGEALVSERLCNLNLYRSFDLEEVRREICRILAEHLQEHGDSRTVSQDHALILCQVRLALYPCGIVACEPDEFPERLKEVESDTFFFHLFASRIIHGTSSNDFAAWFRDWGHIELADQMDGFDPYLRSLEGNRTALLNMVEPHTQLVAVSGGPDA